MKEKKLELPLKTIYIYLAKDNSLDMRFKSSKEYIKTFQWSNFACFMQTLANKLGSPKVFMDSHLHWTHYFNPIYHLKQQIRIRNPIKIYGNFYEKTK